MDDVFDNPQYRKVFFGAVVLLFILLFIGRYFLTPDVDAPKSQIRQAGVAILDNLTTGLVASLLIGATIYFFRPRRTQSGHIQQLAANQIRPGFDRALSVATRWIFLGNRGRHLRATVLPTLAARQGAFTVDAVLTNVFDPITCKNFSLHKKGYLGTHDENSLTEAQAELIATVAVSAWYRRLPSLSINLYLTNSFSLIRLDSNQTTTFLTVSDKSEPCLCLHETHFFHEWLLNHFSLAKHQAKQIVPCVIERSSLGDVTDDDIRQLCGELGFQVSNDVVKVAARIARANYDPYRGI